MGRSKDIMSFVFREAALFNCPPNGNFKILDRKLIVNILNWERKLMRISSCSCPYTAKKIKKIYLKRYIKLMRRKRLTTISCHTGRRFCNYSKGAQKSFLTVHTGINICKGGYLIFPHSFVEN